MGGKAIGSAKKVAKGIWPVHSWRSHRDNMSFRINTNVLAMNTLRNLGNSGIEMEKAMTRLSTGLRINSAAEDPAGLIASEQFRAQLAGIDQAVRNNQDASNYAKTAEGALSEVNKLLNDARALAVASASGATLTDAQRQANQQQLNSIVSSINRIASTTSFGGKKLLDGSAGVTATSTNAANARSISLSGTFAGSTVTSSGNISVDITTAATKATGTGTTALVGTAAMSAAGSATVNGVTVSWTTADTTADVVGKINQISSQTGVVAALNGTNNLVLSQTSYGSDGKVNLVDTSGLLGFAGNVLNASGTDAVADVTIGTDTVSFASGKGLNLRDNSGNSISLGEVFGNTNGGNTVVGYVSAGSASFQVGANVGETVGLALNNFSASTLGSGVVSGANLSTLSLLNDAGSNDAMEVIDKAIGEVSTARGNIGNFIRNTLETNVRSLGVQRENVAATESAIRDIDVATEMTNYTKLQILQQSGLAMLAQANAAPQSVLSLLR